MKTIKTITALSLSSALFCGLLLSAKMASGDDKRELASNMQKASELIGKKVENTTGEGLGKIEDVVIETSSGRVAYAVLSFGGFLGFGDKLFAIPWQALKENQEKKVCVLAADKEYLKDAPGFDKKSWPDLSDVAWRREVHRFYKVPFAETEATAQLSLSEIRRESAQLPLSLRQGLSLAYDVTCKQEGKDGHVRLLVLSMSGEEATVEVTCTGGGPEKSTPCTFVVAKDGTVRPSLAKNPGPEGQPATTAAREASEREKTLMFVQHVFGQGLHRDKLEPGREYTMPGSFHGFQDASVLPATARDVGTLERPRGTAEGARTAASSAAAGTHAMRFEGTATCHGQPVAVFGIAHGKGIVTERSEPIARPEEGRPAVTRPGDACAGCSGKAAYRISDGLLEAMAFEGSSVRRTDAKKPSFGN